MREGRRRGKELVESDKGGDMIGPLVDGGDHNTANNDDAKMDTVESPAGYQSDNFFCSHVSNQIQNQNKTSTFSNWRFPGQTSQTNYTQKEQSKDNYSFNFNDPEVEPAARHVDADVSDDRGEAHDQDFDQADECPIMWWTTWFGGRRQSRTELEIWSLNTGFLIETLVQLEQAKWSHIEKVYLS